MLPYIILIVGIFFLVKGADYLVEGSSLLAEKFGISKLVVGLTIVAFGTSMPELVVNVVSAIKGTSDVAFGNILGSNMANTLLILGIAAMIRSLKVKKSTTLREIPYSFFAVLVCPESPAIINPIISKANNITKVPLNKTAFLI